MEMVRIVSIFCAVVASVFVGHCASNSTLTREQKSLLQPQKVDNGHFRLQQPPISHRDKHIMDMKQHEGSYSQQNLGVFQLGSNNDTNNRLSKVGDKPRNSYRLHQRSSDNDKIHRLFWSEAIDRERVSAKDVLGEPRIRFLLFNDNDINVNPELTLTMRQRYDNPFMGSEFYILYGKVEAEIKAASGTGIISSIYLQNDDLDEIDMIETFGSFPHKFQTNFFIKGDTSNHDRGVYHTSHLPVTTDYNKIAIVWTRDKIMWYYNDHLIREVHNGNPHGFPSSPMSIRISLWAGGDDTNSEGTIEWAGGTTDYTQLPVSMHLRNLYILDDTTGIQYIYKAKE